MADDATLTVTLSPINAEGLRRSVQAGQFEIEQDAFDAAMQAWRTGHDERTARLTAALERRMTDALAAIDRGEGLSVDEVRTHLEERRRAAAGRFGAAVCLDD